MTAVGQAGPWAGEPDECRCGRRVLATIEETLACPYGFRYQPGTGFIHAGPVDGTRRQTPKRKRSHEVIGADGKVRVVTPQCPTCIFGPRPAVGPGRRDEVVQANLAADALLTCHSTLPGNSYQEDPAVCGGFWARHRRDTITGRLAQMIGTVKIPVPPEGHGYDLA